jgi:hypothetical protein
MNRSLFVSLASVTLALFVGGCAADFDGEEAQDGTSSSLEEGDRFNSARPTQKVEGVANIQDPRVQAGEDLSQRAAGHEPMLVKMNNGGINAQTNVDGH